ncbi:hypothetical protein [Ottowia testudinis]|uniref:Uncharacterized protein n=1 Tax=Ottowia testudinis TaxID=2816950 RepID=A0A975H259_9BURK|nr:hypothetical protein [Ottowia testudinis]QTD43846.1 hypothetical protein J1M35_11895 [Ottowia testudinis]
MPPPSASAANGLERLLVRLMGWLVWGTLALMGVVFALSLFIWLSVMVLVSLVASLVTGRPAAVTMLWRRYRDMTRQRWPQRQPPSATPRADAAQATGAAAPTGVQDVRWREVRDAADGPPRS